MGGRWDDGKEVGGWSMGWGCGGRARRRDGAGRKGDGERGDDDGGGNLDGYSQKGIDKRYTNYDMFGLRAREGMEIV